jgi:hypothetical protein
MKFIAIFLLCTGLAAQQAFAPAPAQSNDAQANQKKARAFLDQMVQALGGQNYLTLQDAPDASITGHQKAGHNTGGIGSGQIKSAWSSPKPEMWCSSRWATTCMNSRTAGPA